MFYYLCSDTDTVRGNMFYELPELWSNKKKSERITLEWDNFHGMNCDLEFKYLSRSNYPDDNEPLRIIRTSKIIPHLVNVLGGYIASIPFVKKLPGIDYLHTKPVIFEKLVDFDLKQYTRMFFPKKIEGRLLDHLKKMPPSNILPEEYFELYFPNINTILPREKYDPERKNPPPLHSYSETRKYFKSHITRNLLDEYPFFSIAGSLVIRDDYYDRIESLIDKRFFIPERIT